MAKLKIYSFPDTVLSKKAIPIERVEKTLHGLADDMLETMYDAPGIGLAANQVGVLKRIIVVDTDYEVQEDDLDESTLLTGEAVAGKIVTRRQPRILINPEIVYREGKTIYCEGCLSVPEYTADVERSEKIRLQYQDIDGLVKTMEADGLLAICLQHELDHLDGKLFIDRLSSAKKTLAKKKVLEIRKRQDSE